MTIDEIVRACNNQEVILLSDNDFKGMAGACEFIDLKLELKKHHNILLEIRVIHNGENTPDRYLVGVPC